MNENEKDVELTDEQIADGCKCYDCNQCSMNRSTNQCIRTLARALQAERAKVKDSVWAEAPEWATIADVEYGDKVGINTKPKTRFTRELPKTIYRRIAEEISKKWSMCDASLTNKSHADSIEFIILQHKDELNHEK